MPKAIAVVTGAGSGIGRAVAIELADHDYLVVLAGRRAEVLDEVKAEIAAHGGDATAIRTDVTDEQSVKALFDEVRRDYGRVDLLFNNAGVFGRAVPIDELSPQEWRTVIDTNLTGAFLCAQQAFQMMKAQRPRGGRIINNGSVAAQTPRPNTTAYTASKHAITGLTKSLALDGRNVDIACGQIDIGNAATGFTTQISQGVVQAHGGVQPEARMDVADAARAVAYMASLPLGANVLFMTVMATTMPLVGRG